MKTKKLITKVICALLVMVMIASAAPVMGFAVNAETATKITYLANSSSGVTVCFDKVDGAVSYNLYRKTADNDYAVILTAGADEVAEKSLFIDSDVVSGVEYFYIVEAVKGAKLFAANEEENNDDLSRNITYLENPEYTVENAGIEVKVTVAPVEGAVSYDILRKAAEDDSFVKIASVKEDDLTFYDNTAEDGKAYVYGVRAYADGSYSYFDETEFTPFLTKKVSLSNVKDGVKVTYKKVEDATSYTLYRKTDDSDWEAIDTTAPKSYSYFIDDTAESGTLYYYSVAVATENNNTGFDREGKKILRLDNPEFTVENAGSSVKVTIAPPVGGADAYIVLRQNADDPTSELLAIDEISAETADGTVVFYDYDIDNLTNYTYAVRARNGSYMSYFDVKNIKTFVSMPVTLTNVNGGVKVKYQKVDDAVAYTIYRRTADTDWEVLETIEPRSYYYDVDYSVESGVVYYYCVSVTTPENSTGCDANGTAIMYLEDPTVFLSNDSESITVDYTSTPGAANYKILRKSSSDSNYKTIANVSADTLSYVDTKVEEGETYTYAVRACNNGYISYMNDKSIDFAVISFDDVVLTDEITVSVADNDVIATVDDTAVVDEKADDTAAAEGFDFTQIFDFVLNFLNGLEVEAGSPIATVIDVIITIVNYISSFVATIA